MAKKKIFFELKNNNNVIKIKTTAIQNQNKICFFIEQKKVTFEMNKDNIIMNRILDKDTYITIIFDKNKPKAVCNMMNNVFNMDININQLIIEENQFEIKYMLESEMFYLKVRVGEI